MPVLPGIATQLDAYVRSDVVTVGSPFEFRRYGESGREMSTMFGNLGGVAGELAFAPGIEVESPLHSAATLHVTTGSVFAGNPSVGAWVVYCLGSENENLPGYMVLHDRRGGPVNGSAVWQSGYLPRFLTRNAAPVVGPADPEHGIAVGEFRIAFAPRIRPAPLDERAACSRAAFYRHPGGSHCRVRAGVPHADPCSRDRRLVRRARFGPEPLRSGQPRHGTVWAAVPARAEAGRARSPLVPACPWLGKRCIQLGPPQGNPRLAARPGTGSGFACRGTDPGPEIPRIT